MLLVTATGHVVIGTTGFSGLEVRGGSGRITVETVHSKPEPFSIKRALSLLRPRTAQPVVSASDGGIAVGGDITGIATSYVTGGPPRDHHVLVPRYTHVQVTGGATFEVTPEAKNYNITAESV